MNKPLEKIRKAILVSMFFLSGASAQEVSLAEAKTLVEMNCPTCYEAKLDNFLHGLDALEKYAADKSDIALLEMLGDASG